MFTPKDLEGLKNNVVRRLEKELKDITVDGAPDYLFKKVFETFELPRYSDDHIKVLTEVLAFAAEKRGSVSHSIVESVEGRVGYYKTTHFNVTYSEAITEIPDDLVKSQVHEVLKKMIGCNYIDCTIMQLFKDGKLSWPDVVTAHTVNCSF
jgi:hypothetical protein